MASKCRLLLGEEMLHSRSAGSIVKDTTQGHRSQELALTLMTGKRRFLVGRDFRDIMVPTILFRKETKAQRCFMTSDVSKHF